MGTLYLDRRDLEIRQEGKHLCFYVEGERQGTVPLHMVERVVIRGRATLSTGVLGLLADEGVALVVLGGRSGRSVALLQGQCHGDTRRRIAQYRWYADLDHRAEWARGLLLMKLRSAYRFLDGVKERRPDCRKALHDGARQIQDAYRRLRDEEGGQSLLPRLNGIEGAAAAAYFAAFTTLFADSLEFRGRNRRPPKDPVNAALSLGYTLLYGEGVSACHAAGLDPYVGFYHEPAYYRASLASDLIEPLRVKVDEWVWRLFAERELRLESFSKEQDGCLMNKGARQVFYARYEVFVRPLRRLLRRYALTVARRLAGTAP